MLNNEKEKVKELNNKNNELINLLNSEKEKVKELNNKIILFEKNENNYINKIQKLENLISIKNNELNNLELKLIKNDSISLIKSEEAKIIVNFSSVNQEIFKSMACKNTDIIARLEEKLYNEYPQYKDYNTFLTVNGNIIKRFKTLDENGIKDGNSIIVNIYYE